MLYLTSKNEPEETLTFSSGFNFNSDLIGTRPLLKIWNQYKITLYTTKNKVPIIGRKGERFYIGDKNNKICRFCGRDSTTTKFQKRAHAIPEFLGNHSLLTYEECDECNEFFATTCEDHFSKLLGMLRSISAIEGKKGVPSFTQNQGSFRIDNSEHNHIHIQATKSDFSMFEPENKSFAIDVISQPHIDIEAWKCLLKMAFSLMPKEKLHEFNDLIKWLRYGSNEKPPLSKDCFKVLQTETPKFPVYPYTQHAFLERMDDSMEVPYMIYVVAFKYFTFQIFLFSKEKDQHIFRKEIKLRCAPVTEIFLRLKNIPEDDLRLYPLDFSGSEVTTKTQRTRFTYQDFDGDLSIFTGI